MKIDWQTVDTLIYTRFINASIKHQSAKWLQVGRESLLTGLYTFLCDKRL